MMTKGQQLPLWIWGLLVFLIPLLVYLLWSPTDYSGDDLRQAVYIHEASDGGLFYHPAGLVYYQSGLAERYEDPSPLPLQPRYLFEYPTSVLIVRLWRVFGWTGTVIPPVLALRSLAGAAAALFLFLALVELQRNRWIALVTSFGLAFSAACWTYSTHVDQSINMLALLCLAFYLLARQHDAALDWRGRLLLAAVLALATFYNLTAIFAALAFGLAVALRAQTGRLSGFVGFMLPYGLIVGVVGLVFTLLIVSPAALSAASFWRGTVFEGRPEYGLQPLRDTFRAALGLAKSQVYLPGVPGSLQVYWDNVGTMARLLLLAFDAVVGLLLALPVGWLILRRRSLTRHERRLWTLLLVLVGLHSIFNWLWDPSFIKYWLVPIFAIWAMIALALAHVRTTLRRVYRPALIGALVFVLLSFGLNFGTVIYPVSRSEDNPWLRIAGTLYEESAENDLFISDSHPLDYYVIYFSRRNLISADLVLYSDTNLTDDYVRFLVNRHITLHRVHGGMVYVFSGRDETALAARLEIAPEKLVVAWEFPELTIYRVDWERDRRLL